MKRLLVVWHVWYADQVEWFLEKLSNIHDVDWDLVVTYSQEYSEAFDKIRKFKPGTRFIKMSNVGYDVWPFIEFVKTHDISDYDYVMKLHTKGLGNGDKLNGVKMDGTIWRDLLVNALLGSQKQFSKAIKKLKNPKVGMVCSYEIRTDLHGCLPENTFKLRKELSRIGVSLKFISISHFCAGTMFLAKPKVFAKLREIELSEDMFRGVCASHSRGSLAHVYERIFGILVKEAKLKLKVNSSGLRSSIFVFLHNTFGGILKELFSIERNEFGDKYVKIFFKKIVVQGLTDKLILKWKILLHGHLLNWLWRSREHRRRVRGEVISSQLGEYLERYANAFANISTEPKDSIGNVLPESEESKERIFSIWFQGVEYAPPIVKACWRSVRANSSFELITLDKESLFSWIDFPEYIIEKYKKGIIRPAHFADLCRIELLYRYGGYWLDATDFITSELPSWITEQDFFVYMSGESLKGWYSYVQNCFIRAKRGHYLLKAWREAIICFWMHEISSLDYYVHQQIFKKLVECNATAATLFEKMPKVIQDPTHKIWFGHASDPFDEELFRKLNAEAAFQKTEFKSLNARSPIPGSFADEMMKMYPEVIV